MIYARTYKSFRSCLGATTKKTQHARPYVSPHTSPTPISPPTYCRLRLTRVPPPARPLRPLTSAGLSRAAESRLPAHEPRPALAPAYPASRRARAPPRPRSLPIPRRAVQEPRPRPSRGLARGRDVAGGPGAAAEPSRSGPAAMPKRGCPFADAAPLQLKVRVGQRELSRGVCAERLTREIFGECRVEGFLAAKRGRGRRAPRAAPPGAGGPELAVRLGFGSNE